MDELARQVCRIARHGQEPVVALPHEAGDAPHARGYDGRPACEGYTSCVPLCPIKARYEAIFHVEKAMAAGAIPLINYPEWFRPGLQNRVNCLTFTDEASLSDSLETLFSMNATEIATMRANVLQYYRAHLSPEAFCRSIDRQPRQAEGLDL